MYANKFQNVNGNNITVTATATSLFDLINTAQSTTLPDAGFSHKVNGFLINVESGGNVRIEFGGLTPTSTKGLLLLAGTSSYFPNVRLRDVKLIRVTSDVACSVVICESDVSESPVINAASSSGTASDLQIGAVEIKNATTDDRAEVDTAGRLHVYEESNVSAPVSAQVSVANTATAILASADAARHGVLIINGSVAITLGPSGITAGTTPTLQPGQAVVLDNYGGVLYGITASGSSTVNVFTW